MKDGLASKEKNIEKLKDEISKILQEKEKEVKSALESMTKLEAAVASEKKKVEMAEQKLVTSMEEHRYLNKKIFKTKIDHQTHLGEPENKQ